MKFQMKLVVALIGALVLTSVAIGSSNASKPVRTVTRACFGIQHGQPPSRFDINLRGRFGKLCIVGRRGPRGLPGKSGADGKDGAQGATGATGATGSTGATGATGAQGVPGPQGPPGQSGLGDGTVWACISPGNNWKYGGPGDEPHQCDPGHSFHFKVVIVND